MSVSATTGGTGTLNINEAFGYVFRSPNWFGKVLMAALWLILSFLIIPALFLAGYTVEIARTIRSGGTELPPWDNYGKKLTDGFLVAVLLIIWEIPGYILIGIGSGAKSSFFTSLGGLWSLLLLVLYASIISQYLAEGFGGGLRFDAVFRRSGANLGNTVLVAVMAFVDAIIGALGAIAIFIGLLVTVPYGSFVTAHFYGQFARLTDGAGGSTAT